MEQGYAFFVPPGFTRPVTVRDTGGCDALVDLRSLVQGLGMAWLRWDMLVKARSKAWGAEPGDGWAGSACFVASATVPRWLAEVHELLSDRAAKRATKLRLVWRDEFDKFLEAEIPRIAELRRAAPVSRKITAETVRILYAQRRAGATWPAAAEAAGISTVAARKLAADRYPSMSADVRLEWSLTFGAPKAPASPNTNGSRQ